VGAYAWREGVSRFDGLGVSGVNERAKKGWYCFFCSLACWAVVSIFAKYDRVEWVTVPAAVLGIFFFILMGKWWSGDIEDFGGDANVEES